MSNYFRRLPNLDYPSLLKDRESNTDFIQTKNLFRRAKIREDLFANFMQFDKYQIIGDERPDNVAEKVYGNGNLDWVVLMSNNIVNVQSEWPMSQADFYTYVTEKYDSETTLYSGIHHYKSREVKATDGSVIIQSGQKVGVGQSVSYYDYALGQHVRATDVDYINASVSFNYMNYDIVQISTT